MFVLAALLVTGLGLARLTQARSSDSPAIQTPEKHPAEAPVAGKKASFDLILSGTAKEISLDAGGAPSTSTNTAGPISGSIEVSGGRPVVSLRVTWSDDSPAHRFAKLRLEIPGKPTLEHVFDSPGDIDDIWEP